MLLVRRFGGALRVGTRSFGANGRRALDALRSTSALDWQFSRASGPGGQHVNKVNTRAELRLDLDRATETAALPRAVADRLTKHSTKERVVVVSAQTARTQKGNREACEAGFFCEVHDLAVQPFVGHRKLAGLRVGGAAADEARRMRPRPTSPLSRPQSQYIIYSNYDRTCRTPRGRTRTHTANRQKFTHEIHTNHNPIHTYLAR